MKDLLRVSGIQSPYQGLMQFISNIVPRHCLFCLEKTQTNTDLCHHCISALNLNQQCCQRCALPMDNNIEQAILLCGNCLSHHYYFDRVYSPYLYSQEISYLIRKLKYQRKIHYANVLSELFIQKTAEFADFQQPEALVPMPMHNKRLRQRGYNQALELGRVLSSHYRLPLKYKELVRSRYTQLQADLGATERQKNVRKAFELKKPLGYEHIALVDDVMTTGSTVNEVARLLKKQGVKQVDVWTIARAGLKN